MSKEVGARRSLTRLIDSDDESPGAELALKTEQRGNKSSLKDILLSPIYINSNNPKLNHISDANLSSLIDQGWTDKSKRIFSSLFPDSSDSEKSEDTDLNEAPSNWNTTGPELPTNYDRKKDMALDPNFSAVSVCCAHVVGQSHGGNEAFYAGSSGRVFAPETRPCLDTAPSRPNVAVMLAGKGDIPDSAIPATAARYLKEYQVNGVQWLWDKYVNKQGGILGDDMGLGKTIQVIALLLAIFSKSGSPQDIALNRIRRRHGFDAPATAKAIPKPCLIVCPASVVTNWANELEKWGFFLVVELGNYDDVTVAINRSIEGRCDVVLGSYAKLRRNIDDLCKVSWSCVVWDEGHCLKGDKTQLYKACEKLVDVRCKFILSGTPVQNRLEELWALLNILNKGMVHSKEKFYEHFVGPIKLGEARKAAPEAVALGNKRQIELQTLVGKYMLQRFKEVELSNVLKTKDDIVVFCSLSPLQKQMYQKLLSLPDFDNCRYYDSECLCGSGNQRKECCPEYSVPLLRNRTDKCNLELDPSAYTWRKSHRREPDTLDVSKLFHCKLLLDDGMSTVFETYDSCSSCPSCMSLPCIQTLLKVASHPLLFQVDSSGKDVKANTEKLDFLKYCFSPNIINAMGGSKFRSGTAFAANSNNLSGKMIILSKLLENFTSLRMKTLLFSYSTKMLSIIENYIRSMGWQYLRLDGSTPSDERQGLVDRFNNNSDLPIFLISTRAGGMGLNLTSASKVIIFDCSWNPTMDMQAQDRCYRYGQTKKVAVYRLVAQGTVEELVYMRQLYKQAMQDTAIPCRPDVTMQSNSAVEGGITVHNSLNDEFQANDSYTAKRKQVGEGKRAFYGIEKGQHGELFGLQNLMQYEDESILGMLRMKYNLDSNYVNSQHSDCDSSEGKLRSKLPKKVDEILELNAMKEIDVVSVLNADVLSGKSAFIVNKSPMDAAYEDSVTIPTFHNTVPVKKRKRSPQASKIAFFTGDDVPDKIDPDFTSLDDQYGEDNRHNYYDRAIAMPTLPIVDLHVRGAASKKKISVENPIDQKNRSQRTSSSSPSITATSVGSLLYKPHYML